MSALADSAYLASQDTPEDVLPGYSSAQSSSTAKSQLVTHSYSLARKDGRVWLQLIVQSRAASSDQPPVVLGSQTIQGTVEYGPNLKQDAKPKSISILVSCALTYHTTAFLDTLTVLDRWRARFGAERALFVRRSLPGSMAEFVEKLSYHFKDGWCCPHPSVFPTTSGDCEDVGRR